MVKIDKVYGSFFEFMEDNREQIYNEVLLLYMENKTGDVFLDLDVKSIEGIPYVSSVKYQYSDRLDGYENLLKYFMEKEDYLKCVGIKTLIENFKENHLEQV